VLPLRDARGPDAPCPGVRVRDAGDPGYQHRDPLVGKWSGTVNIGPRIDFIYLTINPDRTLIASWADITARGTVSVSDGRRAIR
jgi:hypothetical protein